MSGQRPSSSPRHTRGSLILCSRWRPGVGSNRRPSDVQSRGDGNLAYPQPVQPRVTFRYAFMMLLRRACALFAFATIALTACGSDPASDPAAPSTPAAFSDPAADGESLAKAWFELLSMTGSAEGVIEVSPEEAAQGAELVRPFLDPAFQLQRATGQRYTRDNYIPSDIDAFEITDMRATEPRKGVKVLRYATRTPGATLPDSNMVMSDELQPRLTVMRWDEDLGRWLIVSHANFNTPVQAICNQEPITVNPIEVNTSTADRELGEALTRTMWELFVDGDASPIVHPQIQVQTAGGGGFTTIDEYKPGKMAVAEVSDFVVTRNEDLIVVNHGMEAQGNVYEGITKLGEQKTPRLLTFLKDEQGAWKLITSASFSPPAEIPPDVDCAPATEE